MIRVYGMAASACRMEPETIRRPTTKRHDTSGWILPELTAEIIAAFYAVYNTLGYGMLESVHANALSIELRARGFSVGREVPVEIVYRGVQAGFFRLDLVVNDQVLVECKATEQLAASARPQVFNYLKCSRFPVALLLHFGPHPRHYRFVAPEVLARS